MFEYLIIFLVVRTVGNAWDSKVNEFRASQSQVRKQINAKYPNASKDRREQMVRNAARRNTLGYTAYQVRHGFPVLWAAFHVGWLDAKQAHEEWLGRREAEGAERRPSWREQLREALNGRHSTPPEASPADAAPALKPDATGPHQYEGTNQPEPPQPPDGGQPGPPPQPAQAPRPAPSPSSSTQAPHLRPVPTAPQHNGGTMEAHNLEAARVAVSSVGTVAAAQASGLEQTVADMLAGGMKADAETMGHIAAMQEALLNAQTFGNAAVASMTKHQSGQEYADSGHAAKTEYLKTS